MSQEMFLRKIPEDMRPWECNVNGVKYVYTAGTEQNVPAEVAHLIDAWYAAQEQESVPGGGGGGFTVKVLYDDSSAIFTPDKELAEVLSAISKGTIVQFVASSILDEDRIVFLYVDLVRNGRIELWDRSGTDYVWSDSGFEIRVYEEA